MDIEIYQNLNDTDCVIWTDENGLSHSMLKSVYDEQVAAQAKNGWTEPQLTKF